ncbi:MAG: NAD-dependent succinate-semialdehyde dehydrogenase [Actinomycetales bacterium]
MATTTSQWPGYRVTNPVTGQVEERFDQITDDELTRALAAGQDGVAEWRARPVAERAAIVKKVGDLFLERAEELGKIIVGEMGKPLAEAVGEAEYSGNIFSYYATEGPRLVADQEIPTEAGGTAIIQRLPVGLLLGIMPWNFPYYQVARFAAPNLVVGNTILLKHAENCPRSALAIVEVLRDAGLPAGVYQNIFADYGQIERVIADPRVQGVSLTGSERAGAAVAATAGANLKKVVLELGGSDPYIVLDSTDPGDQAAQAWATRIENTGQACNSNKRMIVMADIFDDFVAELTRRAGALRPGDPLAGEEDTYAPMVSRAAAEGLAAQIEDAVSKGATLHAGGTLADDHSAYLAPAVLTGVTKDMRAYSEELFGPVAVVYKVDSDEEALQLANDSSFGLGGSVFSGDAERARTLANQLDVGMSNVNIAAGEGPEIPFGGVKRSGFGRELGPIGMDEFVNKRLFYVHA